MTLSEAQAQISTKLPNAGETARPIWEVCAAIAMKVHAMSIQLDSLGERTQGGLPTGEATEVLKAKIAELNSLLDNDARIFQALKDIVGGDPTAAELPAKIKALIKAALE